MESVSERPRLMPPEGAWNDQGIAWYAREHFPKRSQAMTEYASFCGISYIEVHCYARFAVYDPTAPGASEYDGEFWVECDKDRPGAFPVWRCE